MNPYTVEPPLNVVPEALPLVAFAFVDKNTEDTPVPADIVTVPEFGIISQLLIMSMQRAGYYQYHILLVGHHNYYQMLFH